jgi:hypothetical protein
MTEAHLETGNLQEARWNMQCAMMLSGMLCLLAGLIGRKEVQ